MAEALVKMSFRGAIIPAGGGRAELPIVVTDGKLLDDDARELAPFVS